MELTQISFTQERSLPIITFLGRPRDSKKGLPLFLEALEMLASLSLIENFIIWIIGGDDNELEYVQNSLNSYSLLKSKYRRGTIMIWGRVENDALPELLSGSSVLVIPSCREQFGMVAVEAMLCGCPVIGAKVGGLNDLIISQKNGFLFERGNSMALCAVLSGFLRNKPERKRMRFKALNWAKRFSQYQTFSAIIKLYDGTPNDIPDFWKNDYEYKDSTLLITIAENLISNRIISSNILHSHGKHISFKIITETGQYFVKKINEFPSCTISVFPIDFKQFPNPKSIEERFLRELYQKDNPYSPQIIKYDTENSIFVTEFFEVVENDLLENPELMQV